MKFLADMVDLDAVLDVLAQQADSPVDHVSPDDVDWKAVNDLKVRAPRHILLDEPGWAENGAWCYVRVEGPRMMFNEGHVVALGYVDADVAAVYQRVGDDEPEAHWHLAWQRRFALTCILDSEELEDLEERKRRVKFAREAGRL